MLLALNLPPKAPWWIAVVGGIFAILVVKQLFGGLGQNFMNPALATPLAAVKAGESVNLMSLFIGNTKGTIGETSALAILIGAAILLATKVIDLRVPLTYIGTFAVFALLFGGHGFSISYLAAELFGGGLMLGAWFMATDYVTTPITKNGQLISAACSSLGGSLEVHLDKEDGELVAKLDVTKTGVYGVCLGIFTGIFRIFGGSAEGVSYAIIFCNLLVPLIERVTMPVAFGKGGKKS